MGDVLESHPATVIGALFRRARASTLEAVKQLIECGQRLQAQKDSLSHGEWLLWVREHQHILGFHDRTAQRLMGVAREYASLTPNLTPEHCVTITRLAWGNEPPLPEDKIPNAYLLRFAQWTTKHPPEEFAHLSHDNLKSLLQNLDQLEEWIARVRLIQPGSKAA